MTYKFKYRRHLFFRTLVVSGHRYDEKLDKMVVYFLGGGLEEIPEFSKCAIRLGSDWLLAQKQMMEEKAGQAIPLKR